MSIIRQPTSVRQDASATHITSSAPQPLSAWKRVALVVVLALAALATKRGSMYLLIGILNLPPELGTLLTPVLAALLWIVPLVLVPALRDLGSFRLRRTWTVWLLLPIVAHKWTFSIFLWPGVFWPSSVWLHCIVGQGLATGVFEEVIFRGYAFRRLPQAHPRLVVVTTALCFGLVHSAGLLDYHFAVAFAQVVFALTVGLALSLIRMISGSLAWCMLLHAAVNAAASADVPAFHQWKPYAIALVAVASLATLWRHPSFGTCLSADHPRL